MAAWRGRQVRTDGARRAVVLGLACSLAYDKFILIYRKYRPDQLRDPRGRFANEGVEGISRDPDTTGSVSERRNDKTGDPLIDAVTEKLVGVVSEVHNLLGDGEGSRYGSAFHHEFAQRVRRLGIIDLSAEVTFDKGVERPYATPGAIRTDVILRDYSGDAPPVTAIWDLKTGGAELSKRRAQEIRDKVGVGLDTPLIEIQTKIGITNKEANDVLALRT